MNTQGHPWEEERSFGRGANTDAEGERVANMPGKYYDAQNMRITPINGDVGDASKIGGETLEWAANVPGANTYRCLSKYGQWNIAGHAVATWASTDPGNYPPMLTIDGVPMVMSDGLEWIASKPHQVRRAEDCEDGVITIVDGYSVPLVFSIKQIIDAYNNGEQTFFSEFNIDTYSVNLHAPVERPRAYQLVDIGAGGGIPPGQVAYALRFVDTDGNATNWGPPTPLIPIPVNMAPDAPGMPGMSLQGGALSDVGQPSRFGVLLRWRVNNINNYARIELMRIQYNAGDGLNAVPVYVLAHAIEIVNGINPIVEFTDVGTVLETLSDAEVNIQNVFIESAGAVGYNDNRFALGDVIVAPRDITLDFTDVGGVKIIPITKSLGIKGHTDPINHAYYKHNIGGERYIYGIQCFDSVGGRAPVVPINDPMGTGSNEMQWPNRRTEKTGDSLALSDAPCYAVNYDHQVSPTFEPLDMTGTVSKTRTGDPVNIMIHAGNMGGPEFFAPFRPTRPSDGNKFGHDYRVNTEVRFQPADSSPLVGYSPKVFEPTFHSMGGALYGITNFPDWVKGFSIVRTKAANRVVCQGLASYKINSGTETSSAFRVRNKVIITFPDMNSGVVQENLFNDFRNNPQNFGIQCVAPIGFCTEQHGGVTFGARPQVTLSEIVPATNYAVTSISTVFDPSKGVSILNDQLSYARVMQDEGEINPGYALSGVQTAIPGLPGNWVGHSAWRNRTAPTGPFHEPGQNGERILTIASVQYLENNGAPVFEVTLNENLYNDHAEDVSDFMSNDTAAFHEPFYIVNLVQDGAHVDQQLITKWQPTGQYQRIESIIGVSDGTAGQTFQLIDERIEDVLSPAPGDYRYVYVNGLAWVNTNNLGFNVALIINAINQDGFWLSPDGTQVYGVYEVPQFTTDVVIGSFNINPPAGAQIVVRYNPSAPIKFWGGEATISQNLSMPVNANSRLSRCFTFGEDIQRPIAGPAEISGIAGSLPTYWFSQLQNDPLDFAIDNEGQTLRLSQSQTVAASNIGLAGLGYQLKRIIAPKMALPYSAYRYNYNYWVPYGLKDFTAGQYNHIQDIQVLFDVDDRDLFQNTDARAAALIDKDCYPGIIRQWGIVFDCECRAPNHLAAFIQDTDNIGFSHVHYVQRPYCQETADSLTSNGVYDDYAGANAYGVNEKGRWNVGGLKWARPINYDYAKQPDETSVSKPLFGYKEKLHRCNSVLYTPRVTTQIQNAPGYRTYPALNEYVMQSDCGDIQILYSDDDMYAVCDSGIARLLIGKSILNSGDGSTLGYTRQDKFIAQEKWVKGIGCPGNYWQMAVDAFTYPSPDSKVKRNMLLFPSEEGWYKLIDHNAVEISAGEYKSQLRPIVTPSTFLFEGGGEVPRCAGFDADHNELWVSFGDGTRVPWTLCVYNTQVGAWTGKFTYQYDAFLHMKGRMRGMRDASTWRLGEDPMDDINGAPIESWLMRPISPVAGKKFEYVRYRMHSKRKPNKVEFLDENRNVVSVLDANTFGALYLKEHDGWENWVPCKEGTMRLQGHLFYAKTYWSERGADKAVSCANEFKVIK
jgi:hypothetical protein